MTDHPEFLHIDQNEAGRWVAVESGEVGYYREDVHAALIREAGARGMERAADWLEETAYVDASHRKECSDRIRAEAAAIREAKP